MDLSQEDRDRIFQEERARREAQDQLEAEKKAQIAARMARSQRYGCSFALGIITLGAIALILFHEDAERKAVDSPPSLLPKASGKPIVGGRFVRTKFDRNTLWNHFVVKRHVTDQEIVDLAIDLHNRCPHSRIDILDDPSRLEDLDRYGDFPPDSVQSWLHKHELATIYIVAEGKYYGAKWELVSGEARSFESVLLETRTIALSEIGRERALAARGRSRNHQKLPL